MTWKKGAFTLSELLLALGVVGIIATMTIPAISGNIQTKSLATQAKSNVSAIESLMSSQLALHNVRTLADTDFGSLDTLFTSDNFEIAKVCETAEECWVKNYKRLSNGSVANERILGEDVNTGRTVKLKNGTILTFQRYTTGYSDMTAHPGDRAFGLFRMDVNGDEGPNTIGRDVFWFIVSNRGKIYDYYTFNNQNVPNDNTLVSKCRDASIATNCLIVLRNNNWVMNY